MFSNTSTQLRSSKVGDSSLAVVELPPYQSSAGGDRPPFGVSTPTGTVSKQFRWSPALLEPSPLQTTPTSDERAAVNCRYHKAFLFSMMALGLFHPFRLADVGARWRLPSLVYCSAISLGLLVNAVRLALTSFGSYETSLAGIMYIPRATFLAWHVSTALSAAILYGTGLTRGGGAAAYYGQLTETTRRLTDAGMPVSDASRRSLNIFGLAVAWSLYVVNVAYTLPTLLDPSQFATAESVIRWRMDNGTTATEYAAVRGLEVFVILFGTGAYVFPVVYVFIVSGQVVLLMNAFNGRLERLADERPGELLVRVAFYRRLHGSLCEAVACARSLFGYLLAVHLAINFALSMLQLCFVVYVSSLEQYKQLKFSSGVWFVTAALVIVSEFVAGCIVDEKIGACQDSLEKISEENVPEPTNHQLVQLQLFISQLQNNRGYNVVGVFPINRESVLPTMGSWMTYFLLVVQLGSSPSTVDGSSSAVIANASALALNATGLH